MGGGNSNNATQLPAELMAHYSKFHMETGTNPGPPSYSISWKSGGASKSINKPAYNTVYDFDEPDAGTTVTLNVTGYDGRSTKFVFTDLR